MNPVPVLIVEGMVLVVLGELLVLRYRPRVVAPAPPASRRPVSIPLKPDAIFRDPSLCSRSSALEDGATRRDVLRRDLARLWRLLRCAWLRGVADATPEQRESVARHWLGD